MRNTILAGTILIGILVHQTCLAKPEVYGDKRVHFVENYDGDTITVNIPDWPDIIGKEVDIRVDRIDTAEIKGGCVVSKTKAKLAKKFVWFKLRTAKRIVLRDMRRGKYFRIAADVEVDGEDLATLLLKAKLAVKYDGKKKTYDWCGF